MKGSFRAKLALLADLVIYGYRTRYGRSLLGTLWLFAHPLLMLTVYGFVFSGLIGVRGWKTSGSAPFALWLACAFLPWMALQECLLSATRSFRENAHFLTRLPTIPEFFVAQKVLTGTVNLGIFLLLLLLARSFYGGITTIHLLCIPLLLLLQTLFSLGLGLLLAWADLVLADLGHGTAHLLSVWFWLTPIVYPEKVFAQKAPALLFWNPLYRLMNCYRRPFVDGQWPLPMDLLFVIIFALATLTLALVLLRPIRREIPDLV